MYRGGDTLCCKNKKAKIYAAGRAQCGQCQKFLHVSTYKCKFSHFYCHTATSLLECLYLKEIMIVGDWLETKSSPTAVFNTLGVIPNTLGVFPNKRHLFSNNSLLSNKKKTGEYLRWCLLRIILAYSKHNNGRDDG